MLFLGSCMLFEPCQRVTVVRQFFGGRCESCSSMFSCGVSSGTSVFVVGYGFFHRKRVVGLKLESDVFTDLKGFLWRKMLIINCDA